MNTIEAIHTRRSIRRYIKEPISDDVIKELLAAAMTAPSAGNQQPWHFVVIDDRAVLRRIAEVHVHGKMCAEAAVAILVCGDPSSTRHADFWVQDCSAAVQNLLLAAHEKGLGAVWVGIYPKEDRVQTFRGVIDLPDHIIPLALVPMGHPAEKSSYQNRYKDERVHLGSKW